MTVICTGIETTKTFSNQSMIRRTVRNFDASFGNAVKKNGNWQKLVKNLSLIQIWEGFRY